ncbi:TPA: hypothetical protein ACJUWX_001191 [Streptococcus pneumoniae]
MIKIGNQKYIGRNVLNKKYNIVLFLIEHIFRVRNRMIQIGEIIIIVASIILFIDSILSL